LTIVVYEVITCVFLSPILSYAILLAIQSKKTDMSKDSEKREIFKSKF